jgi:hypothetical protein
VSKPKATPTNGKQPCSATRLDGQPCTSPALPGSNWCFAHDPQRQQQRDEARRRGGYNRASALRIRRLVPPRLVSTYDILESALIAVRDGKLDARQGVAMASIAKAMVAVMTSGELEQRIRDLEMKRVS